MDFYKENKKWTLILTIIIVGIIFIASFSSIFGEKKNNEQTPVINSITAIHSFKSGLHDYIGTIKLPTPCYTLSVDAIVRESFPEDVTIRFTIQEDKKENQICTQALTEKSFRIIFQASNEAKVHAVVNDIQVQFNTEEKIEK
ncbi:MAG: hypothetical protein WC849_00825 [Candidatus Paceibacterota bacterium]